MSVLPKGNTTNHELQVVTRDSTRLSHVTITNYNAWRWPCKLYMQLMYNI
jgi:hypothetical protein